MALPLALPVALGIGGALLGGMGASRQNRAVRRAAAVQTDQVRDVATFDRQQREREAAQIRDRMRVIAADSGAMGSLRTTSAAPVMEGLLEAATSLFPAIPSPDPSTPRPEPTGAMARPQTGVVGAYQRATEGGTRALVQPARPPVASLEAHMPWQNVAEGSGSWQALERQFTMSLIESLFMTDRNLWNQERAISAGASAQTTNPLLAGISGGIAGAQAGMQFAGFLSSPAAPTAGTT